MNKSPKEEMERQYPNAPESAKRRWAENPDRLATLTYEEFMGMDIPAAEHEESQERTL